MLFVKDKPKVLSPRLIFPQKINKDIRISEQESKILYCSILNDTNYYYSVETPTEETYSFTGKKSISARSDLSIYGYQNGSLVKLANIELKSGSTKKNEIKKDVEKMIRENITGNWFHTIKNADSKTIRSLFDKFKYSFIELEYLLKKHENIDIIFCFCIYELRTSLIKRFQYSKDYVLKDYVNEFFTFEYKVTKQLLISDNTNGWLIFRQQCIDSSG